MTITKKITRADFVLQPDGVSIEWACDVRSIATSPFDPSKTITSDSDIMSPAKALEDHGLHLSDVVEGINEQVAVAHAKAVADLAAANQTIAQMEEQHQEALGLSKQECLELKGIKEGLSAEAKALLQANTQLGEELRVSKESDAQKAADLVAANQTIQSQAGSIAQKDAIIEELQSQLDAVNAPVVNGVPQMISKMQAKLALLAAGKLETVEAYMAQPDTPIATKIYWSEASELHRDHPLVKGISTLLGMSDEVVDELFIAAKQIV